MATGATDNGGGFDASFGGTDYSTQAAAQLTITDGSTNTGTTALTSVVGGFTAAMVGNVLSVTQAATFRGYWQIVAYVSTNQVTLDRVGAVTAANCTVKVGGAHTITQNGFPFALSGGSSVAIPGQLAWVRAGTYSVSANSPGSASIAGTSSQPFVVKGYNTTRGDLDGVDGTRPKLVFSASTINLLSLDVDYWAVRNLEFDNTGNDLAVIIYTGSHCIVENCKVTTGTNGRVATIAGYGNRFVRNYGISGSGASATGLTMQGTGGHLVEFNHLRGTGSPTGSYGINCVVNGNYVRNNVIQKYAIGVMCDNATAVSAFIENNIIHRCTNGIESNHASEHIGAFLAVTGNIISRCTRGIYDAISDISANTGAINWAQAAFDCNFFYGNTTDHVNLPAGTNDTVLTADPFTDETNYDFSLNSTAGGGQTVRDGGCEVAFADGINTSNMIAGIAGCPATVAPAATTYMRDLWRLLTGEFSSVIDQEDVVDVFIQLGLEALNAVAHYHYTTSTTDVVLVAGTQEYDLPADVIEVSWLRHNGVEVEKGDWSQWLREGDSWASEPAGSPRYWAQYGSKLIIRPAPSAAAVAAAASPVFRYVSKPANFTVNGPVQLPSNSYRVAVYEAVRIWTAAYPDSQIASARAQAMGEIFTRGAQELAEQVARQGVSK